MHGRTIRIHRQKWEYIGNVKNTWTNNKNKNILKICKQKLNVREPLILTPIIFSLHSLTGKTSWFWRLQAFVFSWNKWKVKGQVYLLHTCQHYLYSRRIKINTSSWKAINLYSVSVIGRGRKLVLSAFVKLRNATTGFVMSVLMM
jgi:hypothetical protein